MMTGFSLSSVYSIISEAHLQPRKRHQTTGTEAGRRCHRQAGKLKYRLLGLRKERKQHRRVEACVRQSSNACPAPARPSRAHMLARKPKKKFVGIVLSWGIVTLGNAERNFGDQVAGRRLAKRSESVQ